MNSTAPRLCKISIHHKCRLVSDPEITGGKTTTSRSRAPGQIELRIETVHIR
jgi:hypothetical protein